MVIKTRYDIGDTLNVNGNICEIVSVHLYESEGKHTERYYLGNGKWFTLKQQKEVTIKRTGNRTLFLFGRRCKERVGADR